MFTSRRWSSLPTLTIWAIWQFIGTIGLMCSLGLISQRDVSLPMKTPWPRVLVLVGLLAVLVVDGRGSFSAVDAHISPSRMSRFLNMTSCGRLFQSLMTLLVKNVFLTVVLHLGFKSFWLCPCSPWLSRASVQNLSMFTLSFYSQSVFCWPLLGHHVIIFFPKSSQLL